MTSRYTKNLEADLRDALSRAADAEGALRAMGYELQDSEYFDATSSKRIQFWMRTVDKRELDKLEAAAQLETIEAAVSVAREETRRETLEKVIDALDIKGYEAGARVLVGFDPGYESSVTYFIPKDAIKNPEAPTVRELNATRQVQTDRFWADINTALDVREAKKHQETREATEKKVAGLAKRGFATGGIVTYQGTPKVGDRVSYTPVSFDSALFDKLAKLSTEESATWRPAEEDRPDKASQGITGRVDGKKSKAKK